jgi:hypothetical protein
VRITFFFIQKRNDVCAFEFTDWNEKQQLPSSNNNFFQIIKQFNSAKKLDTFGGMQVIINIVIYFY